MRRPPGFVTRWACWSDRNRQYFVKFLGGRLATLPVRGGHALFFLWRQLPCEMFRVKKANRGTQPHIEKIGKLRIAFVVVIRGVSDDGIEERFVECQLCCRAADALRRKAISSLLADGCGEVFKRP